MAERLTLNRYQIINHESSELAQLAKHPAAAPKKLPQTKWHCELTHSTIFEITMHV